jgi:hypothetical protein
MITHTPPRERRANPSRFPPPAMTALHAIERAIEEMGGLRIAPVSEQAAHILGVLQRYGFLT